MAKAHDSNRTKWDSDRREKFIEFTQSNGTMAKTNAHSQTGQDGNGRAQANGQRRERTRTIEQIDLRILARRTIRNERSRAETCGTIGFLDWGL